MTRVQEGTKCGNSVSLLRMTEEDKINKILELESENQKFDHKSGSNKTRVTDSEIVEGKKLIKERVNDMLENMTEEEKKRTTYGAALVKNQNDSVEMWVSSAGKKGYVPPRIRKKDKVINNKSADANNINRFNDAEQTIMREANEVGAEIISIGATRDMCPACQAVANNNGIIERVATPLKN